MKIYSPLDFHKQKIIQYKNFQLFAASCSNNFLTD